MDGPDTAADVIGISGAVILAISGAFVVLLFDMSVETVLTVVCCLIVLVSLERSDKLPTLVSVNRTVLATSFMQHCYLTTEICQFIQLCLDYLSQF